MELKHFVVECATGGIVMLIYTVTYTVTVAYITTKMAEKASPGFPGVQICGCDV